MKGKQLLNWLLPMLSALAGSVQADDAQPLPDRIRYLHSWFGAVETDEPWTLPAEDAGGPYARELGTLPNLGGSASYLYGDRYRYGFEAGGLVGWKRFSAAFRSGSNGLDVAIDASLLSFEMFFGGVLAVEPRPGMRLYAAAGPALTWMQLDNEDDEAEALPASGLNSSGLFIRVNSEEDDFSLVPYARVGFDLRLGTEYWFGVGARFAPHEFDFGSSGDIEFDRVQWFLIIGAER